MNVKRFTARTSRDALNLVRQAFGSEAVVLSTRPCAEGVEVLAMAAESVQRFERASTAAAPQAAAPRAAAQAATKPSTVAEDAQALAMSTLSFQDYVRERMLRRRKDAMAGGAAAPSATAADSMPSAMTPPTTPTMTPPMPAALRVPAAPPRQRAPQPIAPQLYAADDDAREQHHHHTQGFERSADAPLSQRIEPVQANIIQQPSAAEMATARAERSEVVSELRAMKGLIEDRFNALAFLEKLQRQPRQAVLSQKLLDCGFSPALTRKLVDSLPADIEELAWAASVLERNLATGESEAALDDAGGVYAMVGATGVGKTTSTAKLAAAFATRHGAAQLGLITLDAYRIAAHEQLRTYGRILGVPVHTAHDRASLEDLLDLLSAKKMVLIDTAGMAQRDTRTRELLEMLSHRSIQKLLVVNAAAQGETIEDVIVAYRAAQCRGVVLSKIDEAVKIGPAIDAMIRHKLRVVAVANGQRVPEDWHRLSAPTLVQRALRGGGSNAWRLDAGEVGLVFAGATASAGLASRTAAAALTAGAGWHGEGV
jgi:flagellar biosynthesis protein FlhF